MEFPISSCLIIKGKLHKKKYNNNLKIQDWWTNESLRKFEKTYELSTKY